jgi:hypothetical protein
LPDGGATLPHGAVDGGGQRRVGKLLTGQLQLGASLGEHGLAIPNLLDGVLITGLGNLQGGHGGIDLGAGHQLLLPELGHPLARQTGLDEDRPGLGDQRRLFDVHTLVRALRRQADPDSRLPEGRVGLLDPETEVGRVQTGQSLAPSHPAAQVDQDLADAAGNLEAQHDLILGGQGARGNHQPRHLPFGRGLHPHGPLSARRGPRLLLRRRRGRLIGPAGAGGEADEENQEAQDRADSNRHRPDIVSQNAARR